MWVVSGGKERGYCSSYCSAVERDRERASEIGRIGNERESELWILIIKFLNFPKRKEG